MKTMLLAGAALLIAITVRASEWAMPLDPPLRITGTFGEPRSAHLHTGLDLSTEVRIGKPVYAVASGSVVRMRAKAAGYGRALYLQTDRGELAVYGHLDRFAPALERLLRERQRAQGEFEIDLTLPEGAFRFAAGERIAFSGATGSGPPHLHFELRHGDAPVNPLLEGVVAPDRVAPRLGPFRLRALGPGGWVAGTDGAQFSPEFASRIHVWGPVGIEVGVLDRCGTTTSRLAPARIRLTLDGERIFALAFEELDFERGSDVWRIYGREDPDTRRWIYRMYAWPAGAEPLLAQETVSDGVIDFGRDAGPGLHELCLEAEDAAGRISEAAWQVEARPPLIPIDWRARQETAGNWLLGLRLAEPIDAQRLPLRLGGEGEWLPLGAGWFTCHVHLKADSSYAVRDAAGRLITPPIRPGGSAERDIRAEARLEEGALWVTISADPPLPGIPRAALRIEGRGEEVPLRPRGRTGDGRWGFALGVPGFTGRVAGVRVWVGLEPGSWEAPLDGYAVLDDASLSSGWDGVTLAPEAGALASATLVRIGRIAPGDSLWSAWIGADGRVQMEERAGPRAVAPLVTIEPAWWAIAHPLWVGLTPETMATSIDKCGLYRRDEDGEWSWQGGEEGPGGWGARTDRFGTFGMLEDLDPPRVTGTEPEGDARLRGGPARLLAHVEELGCGFDPRDADIFLDGRMLLAAWDIDEKTLSAEVDPVPSSGEHRWEVRIVDRVGNECRETFRFRVGGR